MGNLKPKEPILAVLLNCLFVGLGHIYAGAKKRGLLIISVVIGLLIGVYSWAIHPTADLKFLTALAGSETIVFLGIYSISFLLHLVILIDGYNCAKRFNVDSNFERSITSTKKTFLIIAIIISLLGVNLGLPVALLTRTYIVQAFKIPSGNMRPTLIEKDRLLACKFAYKDSKPKRGDIAVFAYPEDPKRAFVKRVIAVGGETVEIRNGDIYINDSILEMPQIKNSTYYNKGEYGQEGKKVLVPEGHYFVLGDNSASSHDSRYWGFVPEENFIGKAYKIYYPFDRSGPIY